MTTTPKTADIRHSVRAQSPASADEHSTNSAETSPLLRLPKNDAAELTLERRDIADLIPFARNARTHSDAQVAQIAQQAKLSA